MVPPVGDAANFALRRSDDVTPLTLIVSPALIAKALASVVLLLS